MPLYEFNCDKCGHVEEQILSVSSDLPIHCGAPMVRQMGIFRPAYRTKGGNLVFGMVGSCTKGNRKPKTIGRGHGLGGRRKPPTMAKLIGQKMAERGIKL